MSFNSYFAGLLKRTGARKIEVIHDDHLTHETAGKMAVRRYTMGCGEEPNNRRRKESEGGEQYRQQARRMTFPAAEKTREAFSSSSSVADEPPPSCPSRQVSIDCLSAMPNQHKNGKSTKKAKKSKHMENFFAEVAGPKYQGRRSTSVLPRVPERTPKSHQQQQPQQPAPALRPSPMPMVAESPRSARWNANKPQGKPMLKSLSRRNTRMGFLGSSVSPTNSQQEEHGSRPQQKESRMRAKLVRGLLPVKTALQW